MLKNNKDIINTLLEKIDQTTILNALLSLMIINQECIKLNKKLFDVIYEFSEQNLDGTSKLNFEKVIDTYFPKNIKKNCISNTRYASWINSIYLTKEDVELLIGVIQNSRLFDVKGAITTSGIKYLFSILDRIVINKNDLISKKIAFTISVIACCLNKGNSLNVLIHECNNYNSVIKFIESFNSLTKISKYHYFSSSEVSKEFIQICSNLMKFDLQIATSESILNYCDTIISFVPKAKSAKMLERSAYYQQKIAEICNSINDDAIALLFFETKFIEQDIENKILKEMISTGLLKGLINFKNDKTGDYTLLVFSKNKLMPGKFFFISESFNEINLNDLNDDVIDYFSKLIDNNSVEIGDIMKSEVLDFKSRINNSCLQGLPDISLNLVNKELEISKIKAKLNKNNQAISSLKSKLINIKEKH